MHETSVEFWTLTITICRADIFVLTTAVVIKFISDVILPFMVIVHDCATCCSKVLLVIGSIVCVSEGITPNRDY